MAEPAKRSARKAATGRRARGADQGRAEAVVAEGGAARLDEWLGEIARPPPARRSSSCSAADAKRAARSSRVSSRRSPRLAVSVGSDPGRAGSLARHARSRSGGHFAALIAAVARAGLAEQDEAEVMRVLRRVKAEAALLIALADIGGVWPVMRVTRALTELADAAVGAAVRFLLRDAARARQAQAAPIRRSPRRAAATSCSPWARWAPSSSTIRATSI